MQIFNLQHIKANGVSVETLLELVPIESGDISFGVATFSGGLRHPEQGMTMHDQHEISYIIEGRMKLHGEQGITDIEAGQVIYLKANEKHATTAIEDGKVFWVLYG